MSLATAEVRRGGYLATVPPQEILPIVDSKYESNIRGIFLIGDVTGLPLVKVAANQGRQVIEAMQKLGRFHSVKSQDEIGLDLVIVGGGPAGISAAIEAQKLGLKYVVLERSRVASTVRSFPPGKKVYAEPRSIASQSALAVEDDLDKDDFLAEIESQVKRHELKIKEGTEVARVRQVADENFTVEVKDGQPFTCRNVIVAVGRQGQPRLLDVPGAEKSHKVTYRFHTAEDYQEKDVLIVGGGNSAIEAALMLKDQNRVTLAYRGDNFFRAKEENRELIEAAMASGDLQVFFEANVQEIGESDVTLRIGKESRQLANDNVIIQIGSLPPIDFLYDMGIELDGIWNRKRFAMATLGLALGIFIYFGAKYFVLLPEKTGEGKWLVPVSDFLGNPNLSLDTINAFLGGLSRGITYVLPVVWLWLLGVVAANWSLRLNHKPKLLNIPGAKWYLIAGLLIYYLNAAAPSIFTIEPSKAGDGPYLLPGFRWIFYLVPDYFAGLGGFYYLLYFSAITGFGLYWAKRINHPTLWRRNLTIIVVQWTLWWGIPTFLVVFLGTNPWTPLLSRSINAWPLKIDAFNVDASVVRPGDPAWWYIVAVVGVVWAVVLTFVLIPLFTIRFGKIYCSYICSCGALAETVGNGFRHRGPKGDLPRRLEKFGFVFVALAAVATVASILGFQGPLQYYNFWVGTFLAGAVAIGFYPFLGQRVWCRMWCPLAFWMNFWGRWSKFQIVPEKGKCIDCNVCNQYCQMGIDIKSRALQGLPITLEDTPCVGCAECVMRCPMEILHLGNIPEEKQVYPLEALLPTSTGQE